MTQIDVSQLPDNESLAEAPFPAARHTDFRVHIDPRVHRGILEHARADVRVEICGVLVGLWQRDADGPYALVSDYIRCDNASSKFAEVTFTHESWAQINQEMDSKYTDRRIIGWYHSHPDFGIFLSDRDCFIQEHFFSGAGQVAYVVDPVRKLEGLFEWRDGKPEPVSHYWIGDRIVTVSSSKQSPQAVAQAADREAGEVEENISSLRSPRDPLSFDVKTVLAALCLFLIGYGLAAMKSRWEQDRIVQGVVAHYGVNKLMRLGFEERLQETRTRLAAVDSEVGQLLNVDQAKLDDKQREVFDKRKRAVAKALAQSQELLRRIEAVYGYTDLERTALANYVAAKEAELSGMFKPKAPATPAPGGSTPSTPTPGRDEGAATSPPPAAPSSQTQAKPADDQPAPTAENE
ncbi:MAG: Mov34/MPN/PAD-1 family protein [Pirellulales bacterium]